MMNSKMADHHLARQACIYIRQSTPGQVRFNQESKERQYNLANQAKALGWMPEQIRILDGDLGHSGEQATHRDDFKTLVSDVAMGDVRIRGSGSLPLVPVARGTWVTNHKSRSEHVGLRSAAQGPPA